MLLTHVMSTAFKISHGTNIVVVGNQSGNSNKLLLLLDWILTTTTLVPWDILEAMVISLNHDEFALYLSLSPRAGCSSVCRFTVKESCWLSELECLVKRRIQRNREREGGGGDAARASASSALKAKYPRLGASTHEAISSGNRKRTLPPKLGIKSLNGMTVRNI